VGTTPSSLAVPPTYLPGSPSAMQPKPSAPLCRARRSSPRLRQRCPRRPASSTKPVRLSSSPTPGTKSSPVDAARWSRPETGVPREEQRARPATAAADGRPGRGRPDPRPPPPDRGVRVRPRPPARRPYRPHRPPRIVAESTAAGTDRKPAYPGSITECLACVGTPVVQPRGVGDMHGRR
jgi:hypothetical protein